MNLSSKTFVIAILVVKHDADHQHSDNTNLDNIFNV